MDQMNDWIPLKEAAKLLGYNVDYFRRLFCDEVTPLLPLWNRRGPGGKRRVFVDKAAIHSLIEGEIRQPA